VQAVIAGRLARLSPAAAALAGVAAAIGRAFTADVLAAATGVEEQAFVAALDELWRRGIVRAHGPSAYDFSHGRIRDAAYATLSPPHRRQAHLAIARAVEHSEGAAAAAVALHYENAGATGQDPELLVRLRLAHTLWLLGHPAEADGRRFPEPHGGGRPGPRRLRPRQVRPAGSAQGHLRPGQPVPAQPEHQAQPYRGRACTRVAARIIISGGRRGQALMGVDRLARWDTLIYARCARISQAPDL
jgi:hypothetical protein